MQDQIVGPSRLRKAMRPFVSAEHRPAAPDGRFRVVIISSGSVASVKIPDIVGSLAKDASIDIQVVATKSSLHFYSQGTLDKAVRAAANVEGLDDMDLGVRVWTDADEWSDWKNLGDPILHIELRRWADLVVVAPCSADMLAKIAGGLCDNLATSLLRALSPSTPTILCPAMNTHMYQHPLTTDHLRVAQEKLGYLILGPQGAGRLACGDEGPGKMTDWREIVETIANFATMYRQRIPPQTTSQTATENTIPQATGATTRPKTPPTPGDQTEKWTERDGVDRVAYIPGIATNSQHGELGAEGSDNGPRKDLTQLHWHTLTNGVGGDGSFWEKRWWF